MSPVNQITNPGAYSTLVATSGIVSSVFVATGALTVGNVVQIVTTYSGTGPIKVKKSTTIANAYLVGVVRNKVATGGLVTVILEGVGQVLCSAAVTKAQYLIQSTATAGQAKSAATATLGKTIGTVLKTTGAAGLAWALIGKM